MSNKANVARAFVLEKFGSVDRWKFRPMSTDDEITTRKLTVAALDSDALNSVGGKVAIIGVGYDGEFRTLTYWKCENDDGETAIKQGSENEWETHLLGAYKVLCKHLLNGEL